MRSTSTPRTTLAALPSPVPLDVLAALAALGIDAEERGDEAVALCPNPEHDDHRPSWGCNLGTGLHKCFVCGFQGSFAYLVQRMQGLARGDAEQWVRERKVRDITDGFDALQERPQKRAAEVSEADMWKFADPPAEALEDRGLTLEACQHYGVRWDAGHELWIVPIREPRTGRLWGWQAKNARVFRNHPVNVGKSGTLFGFQSLRPGGTAVLVESPLDVPYLRAAGIDGAVSSFGVSVSDRQISLLLDRAGSIVLALDNDVAGWKGVSKLVYAFPATPVRVFNYGNFQPGLATEDVVYEGVDGADPGNLTDDEIAWGIEHAIPNWRLRIPWL